MYRPSRLSDASMRNISALSAYCTPSRPTDTGPNDLCTSSQWVPAADGGPAGGPPGCAGAGWAGTGWAGTGWAGTGWAAAGPGTPAVSALLTPSTLRSPAKAKPGCNPALGSGLTVFGSRLLMTSAAGGSRASLLYMTCR